MRWAWLQYPYWSGCNKYTLDNDLQLTYVGAYLHELTGPLCNQSSVLQVTYAYHIYLLVCHTCLFAFITYLHIVLCRGKKSVPSTCLYLVHIYSACWHTVVFFETVVSCTASNIWMPQSLSAIMSWNGVLCTIYHILPYIHFKGNMVS